MKAHALLLLALGPLLASGGCEGQGTGQVSGTLYLAGCPDMPPGGSAPAPFSLDPTHFVAETLRTFPQRPEDPRQFERLIIHLRRSGHRAQLTDSFSLDLTDVAALRQRLGQKVPITAPPLGGPAVPLPGDNQGVVRAALTLFGSCPMARAMPVITGTATFSELGFEPGEVVEGSFSVDLTDPRAMREGRLPQQPDVAGHLEGAFRFVIQRGRSVNSP